MALNPQRPFVGPEQSLGSMLCALQCWEMEVEGRHLQASSRRSFHKLHHISTLIGQVLCGILLSSKISYMSYPAPNVGVNLSYNQEKRKSSMLSPNIISFYLYTTNVHCSRGLLASSELFTFPWTERL